jgi:hypothetical protein
MDYKEEEEKKSRKSQPTPPPAPVYNSAIAGIVCPFLSTFLQ